MPRVATGPTPESFSTFGELLRYLRRRAGLTQRDLGTAVDYNFGQICRLEQNQRLPNPALVGRVFVPALGLAAGSEWARRLVALAEQSRAPQDDASAETVAAPPTMLTPGDARTMLEAIPTPAPYEVERSRLLDRLHERLAVDRRLALCGMAGLGKTALAAVLAHEHATTAPVFWLTFTQDVNTSGDALLHQLALFALADGQAQVLPILAQQSGPAQAMPFDRQAALIAGALARMQSPLLVFDNVHAVPRESMAWQLLRHLASATTALMLLTSREEVLLPNCTVIRLGGLERDEALALIGRLAPAPLEPALAARLVERTGGNPMLVQLAVGHLAEDMPDAEALLAHLDSQPQIASYLLETVRGDLSPAAWNMLSLVSIFRHPVDLRDATLLELCETAEDEFDSAPSIRSLQQRHLIEMPARALLLPLVRDFVYATLKAEPKKRRRLHRIAAEWSEQAADDPLEAGYHYGAMGELEQAAAALVERYNDLVRRGQVLGAASVLDSAIAQAERRREKATATLGTLHAARGQLLSGTRRMADAETDYRQALALIQAEDARAKVSYQLGSVLLQRSRPLEALRVLQPALAQTAAADRKHQAYLSVALGSAFRQLSRYDEAIHAARRALALADELPERDAIEIRGRAHYVLGVVYHQRSDLAAALAHWRQSLEAARRLNLARLEAQSLGNTGIILQMQGDLAGAERARREAIATAQDIGDSYTAAYTMGHLSDVYLCRCEFEMALDTLRGARDLLTQVGDTFGTANIDKKVAGVWIAQGRITEARALMDDVLARLDPALPIREYAEYLDKQALSRMLLGEIEAAQETLQRALNIASISERPVVRGKLANSLALALLAGGHPGDAKDVLAELPLQTSDVFITLERQLVDALLALGSGDLKGTAAACESVALRARALGTRLHERASDQIAAAIPVGLALAEMPRLMWVVAGS